MRAAGVEAKKRRIPFKVTSQFRSAEKQEQLRALGRTKVRGGCSQHNYRLASDFITDPLEQGEVLAGLLRNAGLTVLDEGSHYHVQVFPAATWWQIVPSCAPAEAPLSRRSIQYRPSTVAPKVGIPTAVARVGADIRTVTPDAPIPLPPSIGYYPQIHLTAAETREVARRAQYPTQAEADAERARIYAQRRALGLL